MITKTKEKDKSEVNHKNKRLVWNKTLNIDDGWE